MSRSQASQLIDSAAVKLQSLLDENKLALLPKTFRHVEPFYCHFCDVATKDKQTHLQHIKSVEHEKKQKERESALSSAVEAMFRAARTPILQSSNPLQICSVCMLPKKYKTSNSHNAMRDFLRIGCRACMIFSLNRIEYEKHLLTLSHIKHAIFKKNNKNILSDADKALLNGEPGDDPKGTRYVTENRGFYCKICNEYFTSKTGSPNTHCKKDEHIKKLKKFIKRKKEDLSDDGGDDLDDDSDDVDMNEENGKDIETNKVPPRIDDKNSSSSTLTVGEFADVVLTCRANGCPKPIIVWRREDGGQIALSRKKRVNSTEGEKLKLREVSRHDIGGYLCIASNGVPPAVRKRVVLQVEFPPVVHVGNQLVGATRDSEVLLDCYIEAHPRAVNYWKFGGIMLLRGKRYQIEEAPSGFKSHLRLIIKKVREEDFGQYTCVSENSLGHDDASINVHDNRFLVKMEATLVIYTEKHSQGLLPNVSYPSASDYATCVSNKTVGTLLVCLLFIAVL